MFFLIFIYNLLISIIILLSLYVTLCDSISPILSCRVPLDTIDLNLIQLKKLYFYKILFYY